MLGYSADELVGQHSPALFHDPSEVKAQGELLSKKVRSNQSKALTPLCIRPDKVKTKPANGPIFGKMAIVSKFV